MAIQVKTILKTNSRIEQAKLIVSIVTLLKGIKLSNTEILVLSHFLMEGYNQVTKEIIVNNGILKNMLVLGNLISRLRKSGLIVHNNFREELCIELNMKLDDVVLLKILLDNR